MENGVPVIKKSASQKDTVPSIVSINRKRVIHVGDTAANELANQVLRATKTWDGRVTATDIFSEFKRTMGTLEVYRSKNLKKDFSSQELSAEIIKALAANADIHDGGCIVISVPAKFDAIQKTATVEAARLAGFQHIELIQEPIAAAIAYGVATGQKDGFWLVFDLGGGTFDAALLRVDGGVQQVVDTEGDSFLGGKDIDYALVDSILIPYVKKHFKVDKILASEKKAAMLREALKGYAVHPEHVAVANGKVRPYTVQRSCLDFEL
jgi:molecular chaperone DnaK